MTTQIDRARLRELLDVEQQRFDERHPRSRELAAKAKDVLIGGVPMAWMVRWPGGVPLFLDRAEGARVVDVDGNELVDLCLGDTGAMAGHAPPATVRAIAEQAAKGLTTMLPSEDALWCGAELGRRFGLPRWQFTLSATDANRNAIRLARKVTGRPKVLVHNWCYHGSVDEAFATIQPDGSVGPRAGSLGPPVDPALTTRVVEFGDVDALERELAHEDVAVVVCEPALTNIGIVLPPPGYHEALRELTRRHGTLLLVDETHTICAGPGGCTAAWGLEPDVLVIGKLIAGGVPAGAFGVSAELGDRIDRAIERDLSDTGGIGGTLAGNALSLAAMRATLSEVLTDEAFARMVGLGERFEAGVRAVIEEHAVPWHVTRLGCRAEYLFLAEVARDGGQAAASMDAELDRYVHLRMLNEGILLTPFHAMALMSPATTAEDVDRHTAAYGAMVADLLREGR